MKAMVTSHCAIQPASSPSRAPRGCAHGPIPSSVRSHLRTPLSKLQGFRINQKLFPCLCTATDRTGESDAAIDLSKKQQPRERRFTVTIKKPMGMVLAESKDGKVFVESMQPGGNAAEDGRVQVGDVIRKCSARVLKEGKEGNYQRQGHSARPYEDWLPIMFDCDGQDFQTVMAAIGSNNERWGIKDVTLEVSRPA